MAKDLQVYAADRIGELLDVKGFADVDDVINEVENLEDDFDAESYCPYYSQQDEILRDYERDFGGDAEDIVGERTFKATEWQEAKTAYAYAVAYMAFSHYFAEAKTELVNGIREFADDVARELEFDGELKIQVTSRCSHGWAAHNRELADGTMVFESGQLDGCNGMEVKIGGVWVSCCIDPTTPKDEDEENDEQ